MSAIYDEETALDDVEAFMKANLNAAITAMNAEKADSITLSPVDNDNGYTIQSLANIAVNVDPYIFTGIADFNSKGIRGQTAKQLTLNVLIIQVDSGNDGPDIVRKALRYGRILRELFESKFDRISGRRPFTVESLQPVDFKLLNRSDNFKAVGVALGLDWV